MTTGYTSDGSQDSLDFAEEPSFSLPRNAQPTGYMNFEANMQATMLEPIPSTNRGYLLLQKMGWKVGEGLGTQGQGRIDPISIEIKLDSLGVGKAGEEESYHVSSTARRKALDSEKQLEETEEEKNWRENKVVQKEAIVRELKEVKRAFYCELCDKQYSKISEYEQHLQSYDHHHKKRFKDMKESAKNTDAALSEKERKRERERKREERELKRMHEAMLKRSGEAAPPPPPPTLTPAPPSAKPVHTNTSAGRGGWATVQPQPTVPIQRSVPAAPPKAMTPPPPPPPSTSTPPIPTSSSSSISTAPVPYSVPAADIPNVKKEAIKMSFGLPQKRAGGFQFGLKKK
ncbi:hypothetical protein J3Q64DRAFT_1816181 [Phycomyces blakesleeanus]|uniref:G-patch domain-containing protein n=1 Tax=Phycomyces blakesleeanus TaxID=4837 RepID=A0ABR3AJ12_PHYBL